MHNCTSLNHNKSNDLLHLYLHTSILNLKIQNMEKSCVWIRVSNRTNERLISSFSQFCTLAWPIQLLYCYFLKLKFDFGGIKPKSRLKLYSRTFVILLPAYRPLQSTGFAGSYRNKSLLYSADIFMIRLVLISRIRNGHTSKVISILHFLSTGSANKGNTVLCAYSSENHIKTNLLLNNKLFWGHKMADCLCVWNCLQLSTVWGGIISSGLA